MAEGKVTDEAFVTLATNDVYCRGALVLAESLKKHGTSRQLVIMITPHVSDAARTAVESIFDVVKCVDVLDSRDAAHLALLKRPELGITFTKIQCWNLTEYKKCVFMDADMLVLQNIDELFQREELSAAPDSGWPDLFNSGLFVFRPCLNTFNELLLLATNEGSFDGGDQGLLNTYFSSWATADITRHLPFLYNLHVSASYTYKPAFARFGKDTKVVHFLGSVKPWHHVYNRVSGGVCQIAGPSQQGVRHFPEFLKEWWAIYNDKVQRFFTKEQEMVAKEKATDYLSSVQKDVVPWNAIEQNEPSMSGVSTIQNLVMIPEAIIATEQETGGSSGSKDPEELRREMMRHMQAWERGNIDYMGRDSFENIQTHLDQMLKDE